MNVMSVTGLVKAEDLGRTLVHEHVVISVPGEELDPAFAPDRREILALATDQLQKLKDHGVTAFVDPCPIELGRDPELYAEVSQRSGVKIIFATGFYYEGFGGLPAYWRARDPDEIADFYLKELHDGVGRTGLRPGVIKAATGLEVTPAERRCLAGAAMAQQQSGAAIITHTENSRHGDVQQDIFAENGADLSRVLIGHQDEQTSAEPIRKLAERGTFVGMDRIGLMLASDETRADHVASLVRDGFSRNVCLSQDCVCAMTAPRLPFRMPATARPDNVQKWWTEMSKPYTYVLTHFVPMLKARGVSDADIEVMLRDNPRRLLAGGT
jgi:phosphotriesterase-related protein